MVRKLHEAEGEGRIRFVSAIQLAEGTDQSVVQVFRTGTFHHPRYGKFTVTDADLEQMVANFGTVRPKPPTEMVVDYDHLTERADVQGLAAGWVRGLETAPGELSAIVDWTPKAAEHIRDKTYRYISPVWQIDYHDKETDESHGPTLLAIALTNRPFFEGMSPVVLSERIEKANARVMALSETVLASYTATAADESIDEMTQAIRAAYNAQFPAEEGTPRWGDYVTEVYDTFIIVESGGALFKLGYTRDAETSTVTFDEAKVKVTKTTDYTPVRDTSGPETGDTAGAEPNEAAEAGVDEDGDNNNGEGTKNMEEELRELLGLGPDDDVVAAVKALKDKVDKAEAEPTEETPPPAASDALAMQVARLTAKDVVNDVDQALRDGKILPVQSDWAKDLRAKDPEGFAAYLANAPVVSPSLGIRGSEAEVDTDAITLTAAEKTAAKSLGVDEAETLAQKKKDAGSAVAA